MKKIAVSIHATEHFDFKIIEELKNVDFIHIDVMDGKFVNPINENLNIFKVIKKNYSIPIIAHFMVKYPLDYIEKIIKFIEFFVFHYESEGDKDTIINTVKRDDKQVGLAINPDTNLSKIIPFLNKIDLVLIMSVHPGWSGQEFIWETVEKVNKLHAYRNNKFLNFQIDVDGGVNLDNAKFINSDILSSASTILKAANPNLVIQSLKLADENKNRNKAIFLDRDGVINVEVGYLSNPDDFEFIEGTIEALKILNQKGFLLIVITNQAGIARGYYNEEILTNIHNKMNSILKENGVILDDVYYCPHHPEFTGSCDCRKPNPGLILKAKDKYDIDLNNSYMVGDTLNDIQTGVKAKCKTVLVLTGYGKEEQKKISPITPDLIFKNLKEFAKNI